MMKKLIVLLIVITATFFLSFGISQNILDMLWLDAPRTLLFRTALGKANRHAMHNSKITIHHFHFDDMETLQHIL
jgi:hypothetical protein